MPEEDELPDFYETLGVSPDADIEKIRKAYLNLAKQHHSDTGATDDERMKQINEAWEWLRTAQRKKMYDAYLEMKARGSLEEEVEKLVRQKKQEAEEEIRRQKKEAQDQIDEALRRLAGEAKKQSGTAQEQQSTPRQNFSSDFPPPPTDGISQKKTEDITWKAPPKPAQTTNSNKAVKFFVVLVIIGLLAGIGAATSKLNGSNKSASQSDQSPPTRVPLLSLPSGPILYEANYATWLNGLNGWQPNDSDWQVTDGLLTNDGLDFSESYISSPYHTTVANYVIEAKIKAKIVSGNWFCFSLRLTRSSGYPVITDGRICIIQYAPISIVQDTSEVENIVSPPSFTLDENWHTYALEVKDGLIAFFIDGSLVVEQQSTIDQSDYKGSELGIAGQFPTITVSSFEVIQV